MKTNRNFYLLNILAVAFAMIAVTSCSETLDVQNELDILENEAQSAMLRISVVPENGNVLTKATGANHGVDEKDKTIQTLELFVFRNGDAENGMLDTYKKFTAAELNGKLSNIELQTTAGSKTIFAVANSHRADWKDVKTLSDFEKVLSGLNNEDAQNFTMVGTDSEVIGVKTDVTLHISRLVARVKLASIKTNFAGTPYEGMALENVKVYLTNVVASKYYADGSDAETLTVYNANGFNQMDVAACNNGFISDQLASNVTDTGYNTPHYFYCYENTIATETGSAKFTRLVIEGTINGKKYYYPININREGFGHSGSIDHVGVKRNTAYSLNVTICRPGSTSPDEVVTFGTLNTSVDIVGWVNGGDAQVDF